jgi:hypothetical protein
MKARMLKFAAIGLVIASMYSVAVAGAGDQKVLSLRGLMIVDAVDAQRIFVAVDSDLDGRFERLFLYSASERLRIAPRMVNVPGELEYREGGFLLLKLAGGAKTLRFTASPESGVEDSDAAVIRFDRTAGLSQYIPATPLSSEDLESTRVIADCGSTPANCIEVAGQLLPFPG